MNVVLQQELPCKVLLLLQLQLLSDLFILLNLELGVWAIRKHLRLLLFILFLHSIVVW